MSALARRGRLIYLALATVLIAWELYGLGMHAFRVWTGVVEVEWLKSIARPLAFIGMVIGLRSGDRLNRWVVAIWMWTSGIVPLLAALMMTVRIAPWAEPEGTALFFKLLGPAFGFLGLLGLIQVGLGCAVLWLPSLRAYFDERRSDRAMFEAV